MFMMHQAQLLVGSCLFVLIPSNLPSLAQPDPLPNHYSGNRSGDIAIQICSAAHILRWSITVSKLPGIALLNHTPSSTTTRNSSLCQPPFHRQVWPSWLICGINSGIKEVGHSPLPHSSRTNLVWPCPQTLRALCALCGSGSARLPFSQTVCPIVSTFCGLLKGHLCSPNS